MEDQSRAIYNLVNKLNSKGAESIIWQRSALPIVENDQNKFSCSNNDDSLNFTFGLDKFGGGFSCFEGYYSTKILIHYYIY